MTVLSLMMGGKETHGLSACDDRVMMVGGVDGGTGPSEACELGPEGWRQVQSTCLAATEIGGRV